MTDLPVTQLACAQTHVAPIYECSLNAQVLRAQGPPCSSGRAVVFADRDVWRRFEQRLGPAFGAAYSDVQWVLLAGGESCKSWDMLQRVLDQMTDLQLMRRGDALFALGGGSVLDLVGFAASIFRRGVPLSKVPTTLMAQVDAAIGLKNAINLGANKNLVGSFAPPFSVLLDPAFLQTLPARHWSNGVAEIIKLGLCTDAALIDALLDLDAQSMVFEAGALRRVLRLAVSGMVTQLNTNPYELSLQRAVDFGHWLSPVLEMADPSLLHGEAVAVDMALTLTVALQRGLLTREVWRLALHMITSWRLPLTHACVDEALVTAALKRTVQHRGGQQNIPMCTGLGRCVFVCDLRASEVLQAQRLMLRHAPGPWVEMVAA